MLATLLNAHPAVAIGIERYGVRFFSEPLTQKLFRLDRFFDIHPGDTFYDTLEFSSVYAEKAATYHKAAVRGDKIPLLFRFFGRVNSRFPNAKVILCLRNIIDVAASYQVRADDVKDTTWQSHRGIDAAIVDWNEALQAYHRHKASMDIFLFDHDRFYHDGQSQARELLDWLELDDHPAFQRRLSALLERAAVLEGGRARSLDGAALRTILTRAAIHRYAQALQGASPTSSRLTEDQRAAVET